MPPKILSKSADEYCYRRIVKCPTDQQGQVKRQLASRYQCSTSTIERGIERVRARKGNDDISGQKSIAPLRIRIPKPKINAPGDRSNSSNDDDDETNPGAGTSGQSVEDNTIRDYLMSLGLDPLLDVIFKSRGYKSLSDLEALKKFPEKTFEFILADIKLDRRMSLREWGIVHAELTSER